MKVKEEWKRWLNTQHSKNKGHGIGPTTSWKIDGENLETWETLFFFLLSKFHCRRWLQPWNLKKKKKTLSPWKKSCDEPRQHIENQKCYFANKGSYSQSYSFSSSHIWMWELDHKEGWVTNNWCFWTVGLEKTLESLLDCKRSNQSVLNNIKSEYLLEGLILKLNLQYLGQLMQRANSLE